MNTDNIDNRKYRTGIRRGLYVITDCERLSFPDLLERTRRILEAGIAALQYRDKSANPDRKSQAHALQQLCHEFATPFIVNDDVELACDLHADGVHLGRDDGDYLAARRLLGKDKIIGISCYNDLGKALTAQAGGADYVAFGSVFPTSSKQKTVRASVELIRDAKQRLTVPVAAIGGITPENCAGLVAAGADLLAVIGSVYQAPDPGAVVTRFNNLIS